MNTNNLPFTVLERGWLSSNSIVFTQGKHTSVVDTGYCSHADQTLFLIQSALVGKKLDHIVNTHLHSDHCGGNAALQNYYPKSQTFIPSGSASSVTDWDEQALSYLPTGQTCPRFTYQHLLCSGHTIELGTSRWEIHAAPGHDPDSVVLFEPNLGVLISADALWENGFGVVFQELAHQNAFSEVAATLDLIESLDPQLVIPGHGAVFQDVGAALGRARSRLNQFMQSPERHARYGAKVLIKYKLLEWQQCDSSDLESWCNTTPYFALLHRNFFCALTRKQWFDDLLIDLHRSGALRIDGNHITDTG